MENKHNVSIRFDDGRNEFVIELDIPGMTSLEASGSELSEAFQTMAEYLEQAGV